MPRMDESLVPLHYAHELVLFRRRKDGSCRAINTVNGGRLITTFDGERIDGAAIIWCLHHGNWPKFPLAVLSRDPGLMHIDDIYPVRTSSVRYFQTERRGLYYHPLAENGHRSGVECHAHWQEMARQHYQKDLAYVLGVEARDRALKAQATEPSPGLRDWEARQQARRIALAGRLARNVAEGGSKNVPKKPKEIKGMVWHYWQKNWVSVPVPVHVSDDCRRRCCAFSRGAVRAEYQPIYDATWYFDAAGEVVMPLPHTKATKSVSAKA